MCFSNRHIVFLSQYQEWNHLQYLLFSLNGAYCGIQLYFSIHITEFVLHFSLQLFCMAHYIVLSVNLLLFFFGVGLNKQYTFSPTSSTSWFFNKDDEVQCLKSYHLVASICHSGTLAAGHYTAHVLHKQDSQWLLCNDKAVLPIQSSEVDNKYSYVLFYELS